MDAIQFPKMHQNVISLMQIKFKDELADVAHGLEKYSRHIPEAIQIEMKHLIDVQNIEDEDIFVTSAQIARVEKSYIKIMRFLDDFELVEPKTSVRLEQKKGVFRVLLTVFCITVAVFLYMS